MKPRNFKVWLSAVRKLLNNPDISDNENNLCSLAYDLRRFRKSLHHDINNIQEVLDVIRLLRDAKGSGRGVFEEEIMQELSWLALNFVNELKSAGVANLAYCETPSKLSDELKIKCDVMAMLCEFATESIDFSRPRDSLAGRRRMSAFEILGHASSVYEMPENISERALKFIKKNRGPAVLGALLFLEAYFKARETSVPDDIQEILFKLVEKTDSRGYAVGALNILVESGNISEFAALDYIYEWKMRVYS